MRRAEVEAALGTFLYTIAFVGESPVPKTGDSGTPMPGPLSKRAPAGRAATIRPTAGR